MEIANPPPLNPNPRPKRPKAVLIATIFSGFAFIGFIALTRYLFDNVFSSKDLFLKAVKDPIYTNKVALCVVCFPAQIFRPRSPFTYYSTATFLALTVIAAFQTTLSNPVNPPFDNTVSQPAKWFATTLFCILFWQFTFGRKSREFFDFKLHK